MLKDTKSVIADVIHQAGYLTPHDQIAADVLHALHEEGWMIVKQSAIRDAQTSASDEVADQIGDIIKEVAAEVRKAAAKHRPMASAHEGYAVILEELDELWEHVRADTAYGKDARKEAIQIAAMGVRFVKDLSGRTA